MALPRLNCTWLTWLPSLMGQHDENMDQQCGLTAEKANSIHGQQVEGSMYSVLFREVQTFGLCNRRHKLEKIQQRHQDYQKTGTQTCEKLKGLFVQSEEKKTKQNLVKVSSTTSAGSEKNQTLIGCAHGNGIWGQIQTATGKL